MRAQGYLPDDQLDAPATPDDLAHLQEQLGVRLPDDLQGLWERTATFNGHLVGDDGQPGAYFRLFHPSTAVVRSQGSPLTQTQAGAVLFGASEDWDYAVILEEPVRYVDVDRDSGEVLSDLGATLPEFFDAIQREHLEQGDLFS